MRPNILFIIADQFRGDCMGAAGHPDVKTPNLDKLAAEGVHFVNAYSSCPSCIAARAELFSGMAPKNNGRVGYQDGVNWTYKHTLAGEMRKAGYHTECVGKMHVHPLRSSQGFDNITLHDGYLHHYHNNTIKACEYQPIADDYYHWLKNQKGIDCDLNDTGLGANSCVARPWPYDEEFHPTNWVTNNAIDFLRRRDRDIPFFLMASYVRPHSPLDAPQCYFDMYNNIEIHPPIKGEWNDEISGGDRRVHDSCAAMFDEEMIRRQQIGYYACVSHLDNQIGKLLMGIQEQCFGQETLVIFTGDHGDLLSDHNLTRKAFPYKGSIQIPLIIGGAIPTEKRGTVVEELAALRDIMPTCLSAADSEIPSCADGDDLLSDSFAREYIHGEHSFGNNSNHYIVTKTDKYIWYSQTGKEQYFDLVNDQDETKDLIGSSARQPRIEVLRKLLIKELDSREEGYSDGEKLIVGRRPLAVLSNVNA